VPERVTVYRTIVYDDEKCLGCGLRRGCPATRSGATAEGRPRRPHGRRRRPSRRGVVATSDGNGAGTPLVLLCECAGTLGNIDFDRLEQHTREQADVLRGTHWCSRVGQAQMLELMDAGAEGEAGDARQLVFAGCSPDFAARRFQ
jgi:hypothetical protein